MTEWRQGEYRITTDPARVDVDLVHRVLKDSYWAKGIPFDLVKRSIEHSLNFSLFHGTEQVGFGRVITDYATFAYVGDVFVLAHHRGKGLSKWLMRVMVEHPELQGFRRWVLLTRDAHGLYRQLGFTPLAQPERYMERWTPEAYRGGGSLSAGHDAGE